MRKLEVKYFADPQTGRINADDAPFAIGVNERVNSENIRTGTTDAGQTAIAESIGSTTLLSTIQPSVTWLEHGAVEDTENDRLCYFLYNTTGPWHKIVTYYKLTNTLYDTLLSSQVDGGLNFSKNSLIHSAKIVNGYLYWTDGTNNEPRKINIEAAIKANNATFSTTQTAYIFPIDWQEITLIKKPPSLAANIVKAIDVAFVNNFIGNDSFEFAHQYIWYDNETTVTGNYSPASRLNYDGQTQNYIVVTMDLLEQIPDTVRIVNLVARYGNTNKSAVMKQWDKTVTAESAQIAAHNAGTTALTFNFYNNVTGNHLAEDDTLRPFDLVPIYSDTVEVAKNRMHLANNTEGYDTPKTTSLALTLGTIITNAASSHIAVITSLRHSYNNFTQPALEYGYSAWMFWNGWSTPYGYYVINSTVQSNSANSTIPTLGAAPGSVNIAGCTFRGTTLNEVVANTRPSGKTLTNFQEFINGGGLVVNGNSTTIPNNIFHQKTPYRGGITFYDFAMRKCGVVTTDGIQVITPARNFAFSTAYSGINWTLSNASSVAEIPDWAYYYSVDRPLNLRTRFFFQSYSNALKYATKDVNGNYVFTSNVYGNNTVGLAINTAALVQSGLGYVYQAGSNDQCILIKSDNTIYDIPVIAQVGAYIILKAQDVGGLSGTEFAFEIYTPYQTSTSEPYYGMGQMYRILDPETTARRYETLFGTFVGDTYAVVRNYGGTTYIAGAMSPNDLFWKTWYDDSGKANFITKLGQVVKAGYSRWSDTFIPNTAINGLSTFRSGNEINMPEDCGSITKLQLTSKVQGEGQVMLAICTVETVSIYLGESQQLDSTGETQFFVQTRGVIGAITVLKGTFGTTHAESVIQYRGRVFWWDDINGRIIQYSVNGLFAISSYKMTRFWKEFTKQFKSMTVAQIEALGGRPFVFATVDPAHDELLFSIPKLLSNSSHGYLPDYQPLIYTLSDINVIGTPPTKRVPTVGGVLVTQSFRFSYSGVLNGVTSYGTGTFNVGEYLGINDATGDIIFTFDTMTLLSVWRDTIMYPFDIYDGAGKTMVYNLKDDGDQSPPHWGGAYSFNPEGFITLQNMLYSFKQGHFYQHNSTTSFNNFYGVQYTSKVMAVSNTDPLQPKVYDNFSSDSNVVPYFVYFYNNYPHQQSSDLTDLSFTQLEGIWNATILRNKLVPTADGYTTEALLTGEKMRNTAMFFMVEYNSTTTQLQLRFIKIGFAISKGNIQT